MSMGKAKPRQNEVFVATTDLKSPGHPFYDRLNKALDAHEFDAKVEILCAKLYAENGAGRPSIPPGQYFRMVMIGYFEGSTSERGIANGLLLRHDHGSQFVSAHFQAEIAFLGMKSSPAFVRAPEGNGCIERFFRTLRPPAAVRRDLLDSKVSA